MGFDLLAIDNPGVGILGDEDSWHRLVDVQGVDVLPVEGTGKSQCAQQNDDCDFHLDSIVVERIDSRTIDSPAIFGPIFILLFKSAAIRK